MVAGSKSSACSRADDIHGTSSLLSAYGICACANDVVIVKI